MVLTLQTFPFEMTALICSGILLVFIHGVIFSAAVTGQNLCGEVPRAANCTKPHLIFLFIDDLGWDDVSWHNDDIFSPNLKKLAMDGIRLNNSYMQPLCSPSRSAIMTGFYPHRTGLQRDVLSTTLPVGLPLKFPTFAEKLKQTGYSTNVIGKWNLGYCSWNYTPTYRGFDSFFGFYQPMEHFYSHMTYPTNANIMETAYDFRNNSRVAREYEGIHSSVAYVKQARHVISTHDPSKPLLLYVPTQYVHVPEEVPDKYMRLYDNSTVINPNRRRFMARVSALDDDVGKIIDALKEKGLYENSVILFSPDNGGHPFSGGCNYPLRGSKATLYEGGIKTAGFIHSPLLRKKGYEYNGLMHGVDWFATLVSLGGGDLDSDIDGVNMWPAIKDNLESPRREILSFLDATNGNFRASIRVGNWKLIMGLAGTPGFWYTPEMVKGTFSNEYYESPIETDWTKNNTVQLFNLKNDPFEKQDLSCSRPVLVNELRNRILQHAKRMVPALLVVAEDPRGDPELYGGVVTPGWCEPIYDPALVLPTEGGGIEVLLKPKDDRTDFSQAIVSEKSHIRKRSADYGR